MSDEREIAIATATQPTTTAEEQRITAGQRGINRLWEFTQAVVAIMVTIGIVIICIMLVASKEVILIALGVSTMNGAWILIVNSYFTRMNHTKIGGVSAGQEGR